MYNTKREPINLWTNLEIHGMFDKILKYEIYSKILSLDTKEYKNATYIQQYKLYKECDDLINVSDIYYIRKVWADNKRIDLSYYESYIDAWYKEWHSEIKADLTMKYKSKLKILKLDFNHLMKDLNCKNDLNVDHK